MRKEELSNILHSLNIPVNEGVTSDRNINTYPRIVYWDYIWQDAVASGGEYVDQETYQISFYSKTPRNEKLICLREKLRDIGLHPTIYHEYIPEDKVFHSYFALEVVE
ncbi:hypothetical protein [[Clostridium] scindens]|uniref:hypothetical protein n=1 Tax=Clostridium scindens (strain JCM 10418 / VPI 12708) TaxID=29347 RepID=UPI00248E7EB1|nr:hypothetical protein [[Clostridium] scindens]